MRELWGRVSGAYIIELQGRKGSLAAHHLCPRGGIATHAVRRCLCGNPFKEEEEGEEEDDEAQRHGCNVLRRPCRSARRSASSPGKGGDAWQVAAAASGNGPRPLCLASLRLALI